MIRIENPRTVGWEPATRGMRNPMNSWEKSDSERRFESWHDMSGGYFDIGPNDLSLMKKLAAAGPDHRKFMRMLVVYVDVTAPLYWIPELDTYKVGTVKNSCSFMHKGVSKPFTIDDFSLKNERVYEVLRELPTKEYTLSYPYETDEFKTYTDSSDRKYRVYRNGKVIAEAFDYVDSWGTGRKRHFEEREVTASKNQSGYFIVKLHGRDSKSVPLHRLVASLWCEKPDGADQVNHKDGNKGNNSAENLEWVTASENMRHAVDNGLCGNQWSLHCQYLRWKNSCGAIPTVKRMSFYMDSMMEGMKYKELAAKYDVTPSQANNIRSVMKKSDHELLFQESFVWDTIIEELNYLRDLYLETKDDRVFQAIRALLPQGYMQRATYQLNYEVLRNIYHARRNHKLDEWREFCKWIETLPYAAELITGRIEYEPVMD